MIDVLTPQILQSLEEMSDPNSVSIFLPTHKTGDLEQDPVRLRNLLDAAEEKLHAAGLRKPLVEEMLARPRALLKDGLFWRHLEDGLAIFVSSSAFFLFRVPMALPEEMLLDDHFHVGRLSPVAEESGKHFYLLALSQKHVRLLRAGVHGFEEELLSEEHPGKLWQTLGDDFQDKEMQMHRVGSSSGGGSVSAYHGGGGEKDVKKEEIRAYLAGISTKVEAKLKNEHALLLLACADPLFGLYREVQRYPHLCTKRLQGNTDRMEEKALHSAAKALLNSL